MANRIKSISKYSGSAWGTETPIGADAANVDLATSYTTVTESTATSGATAEAAIGKIHTDTTNLKKAGHGNGTVTNYDSTSSETSKVLTTDCVVAASDDTATAWSKFNRFRRRVSNKFADYFTTSNLKTAVSTTGATSTVYTTSAINQYLANVVGYTDATAPEAGSIATQLSTLNDKFRVELWKNPNPSDTFAPSTVYAAFSTYSTIQILYRPNGTGGVIYKIVEIPYKESTYYIFDTAGTNTYRDFTLHASSLAFANGHYYGGYGGLQAVVNDAYIIPGFIYGIK